MEHFKLAGQLEAAFNGIGHSMMSEDFAARLMAFLYVYGGGNSVFTAHSGLAAGIAIAQEKLKIKGGETPLISGALKIQRYVKELERDKDKTLWLADVLDRYSLKIKGESVTER